MTTRNLAARQVEHSSEPMLRVLMVDLSRQIGGASFRALDLIERMPRNQVALAALKGSPVAAQAVERGLALFELAGSKFDPRILYRLARLIHRNGFNIMDTQNIQSKLWSCLALPFTKAALISTLNSWYETEFDRGVKGRLYQSLELGTAGLSGMFIAVSSEIHERLLARGISPEKVSFIPNAIGIDPSTVSGDRDRLCRHFQLPDTAIICCAVGRLVEAKGFETLIHAVATLKDIPVYCLIIGDGPLKTGLSDLIAELGIADRVLLIGFRPRSEVLEIVKASDLFVMPSRTEGMPLALLEAAALGTTIIATRVGGIPGMVTHEKHALLIEPGDWSALSRAIRDSASHPEAMAQLGRNAQRHIKDHFDMESQVNSVLAVYQRVLLLCKKRRSLKKAESASAF